MASFALALIIFTTSLCFGNIGVQAEDIDKGLEYGTKAIQGACWYEYLKIKPTKSSNSGVFTNCYYNLDLKTTGAAWKAQYGDEVGYVVIKKSMGKKKGPKVEEYLPAQYSECSDYFLNPDKEVGEDFSAVLGDGSGAYPFKGWAHCIVGKMKSTHGQTVMDALNEKWSSPSHPWMNEVLERENANRARHGSPPLKLNDELSERAQKWADQLVVKCGPLTPDDHISDDNPDSMYQGQGTGENIGQGTHYAPSEDNALLIANKWYEEIRDYPWPEYKGNANDHTFHAIGHFTATVWKSSQQVGYGLARREGCDDVFLVARYFPSGNGLNKFAANVLPPSD